MRGIGFAAGVFGIVLSLTGKSVLSPILVAVSIAAFSAAGIWSDECEKSATSEDGVKQELEALIHSMREGVILYSPQFRIVGFNPAAERIFHISAKEVIGKTIEPRLANDQKFRQLVQTIFPSIAASIVQISGANEWPQVVRVITDEPDARLFTVLDRITGQNGRVLRFFKLVQDETREQAILQSKVEFINTAAHQLRTPLTAVNWALENIKKFAASTSPDIMETAEEALKTSERALKITNDLLDVAKIEEGRYGYNLAEEKLFPLVEEVVKTLEPVAKQYGVALSFSRPDFQDPVVSIDRDRLGLALYNLIDNAIKYNTKNGSVEVLIEKTEDGFVRVSVRDSGVGIPQEEQQKIFKKFYRASNASELQPNGNGLGLFITKNIVKRHGGNIGFESHLDRGTTFWFTLPLSRSLVPEHESVFEDVYK